MVVGVGPDAARLGLTARLRCVPATETASVASPPPMSASTKRTQNPL
jgi:hypothetical protein